jgi:hypothetical protein
LTKRWHGADPNLEVLKRHRALHRAEHECSGILAAIAGFVHVLSASLNGLRPSRGDSCHVCAAGFIRSSADTVTAARFTVPETVRRKPGAVHNARPAGATKPLDIPADWTPEQALAVVELLDDLRERIWVHYDVKLFELLREQRLPGSAEQSSSDLDDPSF